MNYDEKLDKLLSGQSEATGLLIGLDLRVAALEKLALGYKPAASAADDTPPPTGGIYDFRRPPVGTPPYGLGIRMNVADGAELVKRAQHCVRWTGALALDGAAVDAAWAEIAAIQAGDPEVIRVYAESGADPEMIGVALLLGLTDPIAHDATYFGVYVEKRRRLVNLTPQSWLENEFAIARGGAVVSGGDAPE